ncbi:hypothetical protein BGZ73_000562 [Actinomortierella ambigua]|nr:hypothetical protein BGZ73_000562 [Actinomortierella ambigua]
MKISATSLFAIVSAMAFVSAAPIEKRSIPIVPGTKFDRILVVVLENTDFTTAAANPYFASLARRGVLLNNMSAVTHPSQPNYIALLSGSTHGVQNNLVHDLKNRNLVDLLEDKGISWKSYQESYPGWCYLKDTGDRLYRRKHNPFMSFTSITSNATRCAKVVNANQLDIDIANDNVPQFSFYTPNMNDDGHDTSIDFSSKWLYAFMEPKLNNTALMNNMVIMVTFDEDNTKIVSNRNRVFSFLLGGAVRAAPGTIDSTLYSHYSLLATVEDNWNLGNLGEGDVSAIPLKNLGYENTGEDPEQNPVE